MRCMSRCADSVAWRVTVRRAIAYCMNDMSSSSAMVMVMTRTLIWVARECVPLTFGVESLAMIVH